MTTLPEIIRILNEVKAEVRCKCSPFHTRQGLHNTDCKDYLVDDIEKIVDYVTEERT